MKWVRGGRGLGDTIYIQSVVRWLLTHGGESRIGVRSDHPDVFRSHGGRVEVAPFGRQNIDILAHYSSRKYSRDSTQFEDICATARIPKTTELRLDWTPTETALIDRLRAPGRKVALVQLPRSPMGRTDGFGASLLPDCRVIQQAISNAKESGALIVQVGSGTPLFKFTGIDIDLANQTSVAQLIDVASAADAFIGYCSFFVPLAESFDKPALFVWSRAGLKCGTLFISSITPQKILHKPSSRYVIDDIKSPESINEEVQRILRT